MEKEIYEYKGLKFKTNYGFEPVNFEYGYDGILVALFPNIKCFYEKEDDWQGEWFAVGKEGDTWYFHQGSFGSCSGCDMYEATNTFNDAKYMIDLMSKIIKIGNKEQAIEYLKKAITNSWDDANRVIVHLIEHIEKGD